MFFYKLLLAASQWHVDCPILKNNNYLVVQY